MAKKKNKKTSKIENSKERVTLEAIEAMSDSDDEQVPESEWNTKAKNLKQAIVDGKFDDLIEKFNGMEEDSDDDIEEATLDSSSDDDVEEDEQEDEEESESEPVDEEEEEEEEEDGDEVEEREEKMNESNDDSESSSDEEEEENEKVKKMRVNNSQNSKALAIVTSELVASHSKMPWAETFDVIAPTPLPFGESGDSESSPVDVHDDLKREVAFYNMALEAVHEARKECKKANVPFSRPDDFFAEMVKTDGKSQRFCCPGCRYSSLFMSLTKNPFVYFFFRSYGKSQG